MKVRFLTPLCIFLLLILIGGCQNNELVEQNAPNTAVLVETERLASISTNEENLLGDGPRVEAVSGIPTITSINGSKVQSGVYKGFMQADYDSKTDFWIGGGSLGAGTITFHSNNYSMASIDITSGVTVMGKSKSTLSAVPETIGFRFCQRIGTCTSISNPYQVSMVPSVYNRLYGSPEWWSAKRRLEVNKTAIPRDQTYTTRTGTVSPLFIPKAHDILIWSNHQAFIENVESVTRTPVKDSKGVVVYTDVRYVYLISEVSVAQNSIITTRVTTTIRETPNQPNGYTSGSAWRSGFQTASALYYYR